MSRVDAQPLGLGESAFDLLPSLIAVLDSDGRCEFANAAFEDLLALPRRQLLGTHWLDWMADPSGLAEPLAAVARGEFASARADALLKRQPGVEPLAVQVILSPLEGRSLVLLQMIEVEQQTRQDREERALEQARANKELIRNLAHEIKNPLGGIRGAAQLLEMELESPTLGEYTQVIIHEADRLQALVDRLLAPHRHARQVGDVNIHEVCERVRSLLLAEYPRGLAVRRDYDTSIPEFRGDREQLIQAVLNIGQNAALALADRRAAGDGQIVFRTRVARQVTIGKTRFRLALELHVEDNGPGVDPAIRDQVFNPLVTGREGGLGMGLTLAQTYVQQHQGLIECSSVPGQTLFKIVIGLP